MLRPRSEERREQRSLQVGKSNGKSREAVAACKHINLLLRAASVAVGQGGLADLPYNTRKHWEDQSYHMIT